jgi:YfaZ precursor
MENKMKSIVCCSVLLLGLLAGSCWGADFSLLLNNDSVQGNLNIDLDKNDYGASFAGLRLLYNDDNDTLLGSVSGGVSGEPGNIPGVKVGAQVLANLGNSNNDRDLLVIGLGLLASYQPPQLQGLGVYARAQYAPELLCFLDSEGLYELAIGLSYTVTPKATLSLEYQNTDVDFKNAGHQNIDDSLRLGVIFHF